MENDSIKIPLDEEDIEEMLSKFTPLPSERFFRTMSNAPWQTQRPCRSPRPSINLMSERKVIWGLAILGLICTILLIIIIPSARVAAGQIIHLFLPAQSNQLDVQVPLTSPGDMLDFSDPANFPLSVSEVQQLASFKVKEISILPSDLSFIGSRYDPSYKAVTLLYKADNFNLFLTERSRGNSEDLFSIGASAKVKNVKIGNYDGEFVLGGWNAISTQPATGNHPPTSSVNIYAIWDNELPQSTLRWQADNIIFELRCDGEGGPSQSELINIANELK